jgi:hypothetical protein
VKPIARAWVSAAKEQTRQPEKCGWGSGGKGLNGVAPDYPCSSVIML